MKQSVCTTSSSCSTITTTTFTMLTTTTAIIASTSFRPDFTSTPTYKMPKTSTPLGNNRYLNHRQNNHHHRKILTSSHIEGSILKPQTTTNYSLEQPCCRPRISLVRTSTRNFFKDSKSSVFKHRVSTKFCDLSKMYVSRLAIDEKPRMKRNRRPRATKCCSNSSSESPLLNAADIDFNQLFYSDKQLEKLKRRLIKKKMKMASRGVI